MREVFAVHRDLGGLFDECIYQQELARRLGESAMVQVPLVIAHRSFRKTYFLDLLVEGAVVLELKTVDALHDRHRAQLLNYLFLLDLRHGKLINLRSEAVEHEFVNTTRRTADRKRFAVDDSRWVASAPGADPFVLTLLNLIEEWGLGLEVSVYEEALGHLLGGAAYLPVAGTGDAPLGTQRFRLAHPRTVFKLTGFRQPPAGFAHHCQRLLSHLPIEAILWANLTFGCVTLRTFLKSGQED